MTLGALFWLSYCLLPNNKYLNHSLTKCSRTELVRHSQLVSGVFCSSGSCEWVQYRNASKNSIE